jgi:anti-sigma B factor antagonist
VELPVTTEHISAAIAVVVPEGDVDLETAPALESALHSATDAGARHVVVDLSCVPSLDSTGLGVLVNLLKQLRAEQGSVTLIVGDGSVRRLLEVTTFDQVFTVCDSREAALDRLGA